MSVQNDRPATATASRESVFDDVRRIVGQHMEIDPATIREGDALINDLGCDSLDVIEIAMEVEEHFDVTVPDGAVEEADTVGRVVNGVMELLGQPAE